MGYTEELKRHAEEVREKTYQETYEQISIPKSKLTNELKFL